MVLLFLAPTGQGTLNLGALVGGIIGGMACSASAGCTYCSGDPGSC